MEMSPGLWVTDSAPQEAEGITELLTSIERLVASVPGPVAILFDATGPVRSFSTEVVQGYLQVIKRHRADLMRIYVASSSPTVRFAGSAARLVLGNSLHMFASVSEAIAHHEAQTRARSA
ncbi:MAG: hypothetical protein SangKO_056950 [Sandaracinaceae bacterium]